MSYHRLLEQRMVGGRMREIGSLIDYQGPSVAWLEPLEVPQHSDWIRALRGEGSPRHELRSAA